MRVVAIGMVRDEEDILPETAGQMTSQVDEVVILDNRSTDRSRGILEELGVRVIDDPEVGYTQSEKMTRLAHSLEADWVVPFDADEFWYATDGRRIADVLASLPPEAMICEAVLWNHVATGLDPEGPPVASLSYRRPWPTPHRKVACRLEPDLVIASGNHDAAYGDRLPLRAANLLAIRHYPYRSAAQMIKKVRNGAEALRAADLPREFGLHWRQADDYSDEDLEKLFRQMHFSEDAKGLVHDPAPMPGRSLAGAG